MYESPSMWKSLRKQGFTLGGGLESVKAVIDLGAVFT
jgi:hypothetical protein